MWITKAHASGRSVAITIPWQMAKSVGVVPGEYYAMILTDAGTIEFTNIEGMLKSVPFKRKEQCV